MLQRHFLRLLQMTRSSLLCIETEFLHVDNSKGPWRIRVLGPAGWMGP